MWVSLETALFALTLVVGFICLMETKSSFEKYFGYAASFRLSFVYAVTWVIWFYGLRVYSQNLWIGLSIAAVFPFVTWASTFVLLSISYYVFISWPVHLIGGIANYVLLLGLMHFFACVTKT